MDQTRIARWNTRAIEVCDRLHETINAKIEGDAGRMPERGMFNCGDVLAATGIIAELRAELAGVIDELHRRDALEAERLAAHDLMKEDDLVKEAVSPLYKHKVANYPSITEWREAGSPSPNTEAFDTFYSEWKSKAWGVPVEARTLGASS